MNVCQERLPILRRKKKKQKYTEPQRLVQHTNTHIIVVPEKKTRKRSREKIFEETVNENFPNLK